MQFVSIGGENKMQARGKFLFFYFFLFTQSVITVNYSYFVKQAILPSKIFKHANATLPSSQMMKLILF